MSNRPQADGLLRWYPPQWRARYGDELAALVEDELDGRQPGPFLRMSLAVHGLSERIRSVIFPGRLPDGDPVRDGSLVVLGAFTVFCWAGGSFAKLTEHFASSMPPHTQVLPNNALTSVQVLTPVAGLAVVLGVLLAVPAYVTFVRSGGWSEMRRPALVAFAVSALAIAVTVGDALWARNLTSAQRNGGDGAYSAAFFAAVVGLCMASALWARLATVVARRVRLPRVVVRIEGALAIAVSGAMGVMTAMTAVWWGSVAEAAPRLVDGGSSAPGAAPVDAQIALTMALMLGSTIVGICGVTSVARGRAATPV